MIKAVANITKRSLFDRATISLDHLFTVSRLKAMSTKGMDTPADTDTIDSVSVKWVPARGRSADGYLTDNRYDSWKRHFPFTVIGKRIELDGEERGHE